MKRILLAVLALAASGCVAYAQPHQYSRYDDDRQWRGPRHERVYIPDRIERNEYWRHGRRVIVEERYRCVEQRGRRCVEWRLIDRDRFRR